MLVEPSLKLAAVQCWTVSGVIHALFLQPMNPAFPMQPVEKKTKRARYKTRSTCAHFFRYVHSRKKVYAVYGRETCAGLPKKNVCMSRQKKAFSFTRIKCQQRNPVVILPALRISRWQGL